MEHGLPMQPTLWKQLCDVATNQQCMCLYVWILMWLPGGTPTGLSRTTWEQNSMKKHGHQTQREPQGPPSEAQHRPETLETWCVFKNSWKSAKLWKVENAEIAELLYQNGQQGNHRGAQGRQKRPKWPNRGPRRTHTDSKKDPATSKHNLNGKTQCFFKVLLKMFRNIVCFGLP